MSMIRKDDRVHVPQLGLTGRVTRVGADGTLTISNGLIFNDDDCQILCGLTWSGVACGNVAEWFDPKSHVPVCEKHTELYGCTPLLTARPEPEALCVCACGESLDDAETKGIWTIADIAAEYRDCIACKSTRAYVPRDRIDGKPVQCRRRDEIVAGWEEASIFDAIEMRDRYATMGTVRLLIGEELVRDGVVLARTFEAANGSIAWRVLPPEKE